jgi:mono/diheme cytochrome c family protein
MRVSLLLLVSAALHAQNAAIERGSQLYRTHCAVPYCHGPEGTAGRAPKLIGHSQSVNSMFKVISWGIPGTGMPEFTTRLKTEEIADLVAYAMTLRGASPAPAPVAAPRTASPDAKAGRALFFDSGRIGSCGNCHELDGWGVPVGPDIAAAPSERLADLRRVPHSRVRTARPPGGGPVFPVLLVENTEARVRVYDLTGPIPVLRTFAPGQVALSPNTSWQHEQATRPYTDAELDVIGRYLRWVSQGLKSEPRP